jgi:hypothetical protein
MAESDLVDDPENALAEGVAAMALVRWLIQREFKRSPDSRALQEDIDLLASRWATGAAPRFREAADPGFRLKVATHILKAGRGGDLSELDGTAADGDAVNEAAVPLMPL